jgi:two-component system sensor histidine kinase NreB
VQLVVQDDGAGFDPEQLRRPTRKGGLGLYGMQERAEIIGGMVTIETQRGRGTRVKVTAPLVGPEPV